MPKDQIKLHPNPLGKPNGLTVEGLAQVIAVIQNDIEWIKNEFEKRNGQIDEMQDEIRGISELLKVHITKEQNLEGTINDIKKTLKDHEQRIRATERHDWMEIGVAATLSSLLTGGVVMLILKFIGG